MPGGNIDQYLALGDSYTIGEAVDEDERWLALLARRLAEGGVLVQATFPAQTGWTTDELEQALDQADLSGAFDLVSLLIGVNDQYRGRRLDAYRDGFTRLLARATALARPAHLRATASPPEQPSFNSTICRNTWFSRASFDITNAQQHPYQPGPDPQQQCPITVPRECTSPYLLPFLSSLTNPPTVSMINTLLPTVTI
jgi:lysophospholipase L1-like esterase